MTLTEFKRDIKNLTNLEIYDKYIAGNDTYYFEEYRRLSKHSQAYDDFKRFLSRKLSVRFNNISIVGSAKSGYSLHPKKNFKKFNNHSDIDIILVSSELFYEFWGYYLQMRYEYRSPIRYYDNITSSIFKKFIKLDSLDPTIEGYKDWLIKIDDFKKDIQTDFLISNKINYRIFESWDSAEMYYLDGIHKLKKQV